MIGKAWTKRSRKAHFWAFSFYCIAFDKQDGLILMLTAKHATAGLKTRHLKRLCFIFL
jgi:hypothetical protein